LTAKLAAVVTRGRDPRLVLVEFETADFEGWIGALEPAGAELGIDGMRVRRDAGSSGVVDVTFPVDGDEEARRLGHALRDHPALTGPGLATGRFIGAPRLA
jgi:hypothetical protein